MEKTEVNDLHHFQLRNIRALTAPILAFTIGLLLSGCGGGASGGTADSGTSPPTGDNNVALAWDPANVTNLSGYRIYYGTSPRNYIQPYGQGISVGKITAYTLMGLSSQTQYYFAVTAFDAAGNESGFSNEASKVIP